MNTTTLPRPLALHTPWPLRWARAVGRWMLAPRPVPHAVQLDLSLHVLRDIGAPPEWERGANARCGFDHLERAALRMQGMHAPLGPPQRW